MIAAPITTRGSTEARDDRDAGQYQRHARGDDAARCPVRAMQIRPAQAQHDVRSHHQHVGDGRAEHRDEDQQVALAGQREQEADHTGDHGASTGALFLLVSERLRGR